MRRVAGDAHGTDHGAEHFPGYKCQCALSWAVGGQGHLRPPSRQRNALGQAQGNRRAAQYT